MKIPKDIDTALKIRLKAAKCFCYADFIISKFILDNGLEDDIDTFDFSGGVESLVNPDDSDFRIRLAIKKK